MCLESGYDSGGRAERERPTAAFDRGGGAWTENLMTWRSRQLCAGSRESFTISPGKASIDR
jgi:hypothetical protein